MDRVTVCLSDRVGRTDSASSSLVEAFTVDGYRCLDLARFFAERGGLHAVSVSVLACDARTGAEIGRIADATRWSWTRPEAA